MYESFYHLQGKPFNLTPDVRFFFHSAAHKRVLAFLRYGMLKREGFVEAADQDIGAESDTDRCLARDPAISACKPAGFLNRL